MALGCYGLSQNPECAKAQIMTGHRSGLLRDLQRQQCKIPQVALVFDLLFLLLFFYLEGAALQYWRRKGVEGEGRRY